MVYLPSFGGSVLDIEPVPGDVDELLLDGAGAVDEGGVDGGDVDGFGVTTGGVFDVVDVPDSF